LIRDRRGPLSDRRLPDGALMVDRINVQSVAFHFPF
jgi:hypothetical protein